MASSNNLMNLDYAFMENWFPSSSIREREDWIFGESFLSPRQTTDQNIYPESIISIDSPGASDAQSSMAFMSTLENLSAMNYSDSSLPIPPTLDNAYSSIGEPSFSPIPIYNQNRYPLSVSDVKGLQSAMNGMHTLSFDLPRSLLQSLCHPDPQMISSIPFQDNHVPELPEQENDVYISNDENQTDLPFDLGGTKKRAIKEQADEGEKHSSSKGRWTKNEDRRLRQLVKKFGKKKWTQVAKSMSNRAGKQCRERWYNHLRPEIKMDPWTAEEEAILVQLHKQHGNKWAMLSKLLPGRTENMIKNHWNATKRKKNNRGLTSRVLAEYISASTRSSVDETQAEEPRYVLNPPVVDQAIPEVEDDSEGFMDHEESFDISWLLDNRDVLDSETSIDALLLEIKATNNSGLG